MVADPKALQYILHVSGYNFPKAPDASHTIRMLTGDGVGCTKGEFVKAQLTPIQVPYERLQGKPIVVRGKLWLRRFPCHI
jgi:hypothetical protein